MQNFHFVFAETFEKATAEKTPRKQLAKTDD
jgi:hypothetical protein